MSLIRLSDTGKIYSGNGSSAVGIRNINLSFESGEFVAVTGQSGSGKTTLLNVIGGIDSYDEGELYIEDSPTSHFTQKDWEKYREDYISFIFQDYNILESFTVLENVELALLHIKDGKLRRKRALELISKVGLDDKISSKGAKLSGGQKQRTVIARALAKDSPIILADEPTGNLDSKSAGEIIRLLKEISENKLVIMVTHDFDSVKDIVTREVRIFDGSVEYDRKLQQKAVSSDQKKTTSDDKNSLVRSSAVLGLALYRSKPVFTVFLALMMIFPIFALYGLSIFVAQTVGEGSNKNLFTYIPGRIVVSSADGQPFTEEFISEVAKKTGAESYMFYDKVLDDTFSYSHIDYARNIYVYFNMTVSVETPRHADIGRFPESPDEIFLSLPIYYQSEFGKNSIADIDLNLFSGLGGMKICGIDYYYDNTVTPKIHMTKEGLQNFTLLKIAESSFDSIKIFTTSFGTEWEENYYFPGSAIRFTPLLAKNEIFSPQFKNFDNATAHFSNYQSQNELHYDFTVKDSLEGYSELSYDSNVFFVSTEFLTELTNEVLDNSVTQSSLFFSSDAEAKKAIEVIKDSGLAYLMSDAKADVPFESLSNALSYLGMIILTIFCLIFLTLFVIICTSRAVMSTKDDVAVLRSMGIRSSVLKAAFVFRMMLSLVPACILLTVTAFIVYLNPTSNKYVPFLHARDYMFIFFGMLTVTLLVTLNFVKRIFKVSVRRALKEGERI